MIVAISCVTWSLRVRDPNALDNLHGLFNPPILLTSQLPPTLRRGLPRRRGNGDSWIQSSLQHICYEKGNHTIQVLLPTTRDPFKTKREWTEFCRKQHRSDFLLGNSFLINKLTSSSCSSLLSTALTLNSCKFPWSQFNFVEVKLVFRKLWIYTTDFSLHHDWFQSICLRQ